MKVAVVSYYAVTNIGDKILTETVCWFLRKNGCQCKIVDLNGRYPFRYKGIIGFIERKFVKLFIKRNSDESIYNYFSRVISGCDLILFAGGAILDMKLTDSSHRIAQIAKVAEQYNIPIVFNAVGLWGNDYNGMKGKNIRYALSCKSVKSISARERLDDLNTFLIDPVSGHKAFRVSDTAVWCSECYGIKPKNTGQKVGINIISYETFAIRYPQISKREIIDIYIKIYSYLKSRNLDCFFFTNGVTCDTVLAKSVIGKLGLDKRKNLLSFDTMKGKEFVSLLAEFDFIVSSRLHTSICAYSLKIPTVCLSWDEKFNEFYRYIGCCSRCLSPYDFNNGNFKSVINDALLTGYDKEQYDSYRQLVKDSLDNICQYKYNY